MDDATRYVLPGGATRSEHAPPYHLVPREGIKRIALRFGLGAERHGAWNWLKSLDTEEHAYLFAAEAYNHGMEHLLKSGSGIDPTDDHLGAVGWMVTVLSMIEARFNKPWTELRRSEFDKVPDIAVRPQNRL